MSSPTQTLVFATRNPHKAAEVRALLKGRFHILTLPEAGINEEIPEPFPTLEENALAKTDFLFQRLGCDCFSEDTGLEVNALGGEPGVRSARYAGEPPKMQLISNDCWSACRGSLQERPASGPYSASAFKASRIALKASVKDGSPNTRPASKASDTTLFLFRPGPDKHSQKWGWKPRTTSAIGEKPWTPCSISWVKGSDEKTAKKFSPHTTILRQKTTLYRDVRFRYRHHTGMPCQRYTDAGGFVSEICRTDVCSMSSVCRER